MMVTLYDEERIMKAHDETVRNQGFNQGISQGIKDEIFSSVYEKDYSVQRGAEKMNISEEEFFERFEKWKKDNNKN